MANNTTLVTALHGLTLLLLILAAIQDYQTRLVANWLTIPVFVMGILSLFLVSLQPLPVLATFVLLLFWHFGWIGGADTKVLIGLWGFWSLAAIVSMLLLGIEASVRILKKQAKPFPGIVAVAVGSGLTFAGELSIMLLNRGVLP